MDIYHVWFDLRPGTRDTDFCDRLTEYLGHLEDESRIQRYRVTRRKLGFGPPGLGEFHVMIEVRNLSELDGAFQYVGKRSGIVEDFHAAVNQRVVNFQAALYRDFPDPFRERGQEKF
jgi:hypothetical protein